MRDRKIVKLVMRDEARRAAIGALARTDALLNETLPAKCWHRTLSPTRTVSSMAWGSDLSNAGGCFALVDPTQNEPVQPRSKIGRIFRHFAINDFALIKQDMGNIFLFLALGLCGCF